MYQLVNIDPKNFNIEDDFWMMNPQLRYYPTFKELYDGDKSKGKVHSSKVMWCVWMLRDPHPLNKVFHRLEDDQKTIINAYYNKFPWNSWENLEAAYMRYCISRPKRDFMDMCDTLTKRARFLKDEEYYFDRPMVDPLTNEILRDGRGNIVIAKGTATQLDTIHKNTLAISQQYEKAESIFINDVTDNSRIHGGREKTLKESGGLILDISDEYEEE